MKLSRESKTVVKICLWAGVLTWMIFYFAFALIMSGVVASFMRTWGRGLVGMVLVFVAPIWVIFTVLLTIVAIARWVNKKLGSKDAN